MLRSLALLCALALGTAHATAQCVAIPGTGCPGQSAPLCGTPPQIGTTFVWRCPPSCFGTGIQQVVILGLPLTTPVSLFPPLTCVPPSCELGCQPTFVFAAPGMTIPIPNNPALVGLTLCIQCACVDTGVPCLSLTVANSVTII